MPFEEPSIADDPPFASDSMVRRVHREAVLLVGGGRALLLQIAHPSVAAGVAEHSSFRHQPLQRLLRTLRLPLAIVYGTRAQSLEAASLVNRAHRGVTGRGYAASDPDLLLWVLATLIDTSLASYRRFVGPLPRSDAEAYYRDMGRVGEMLGLPAAYLPPDLGAFEAYFEAMTATLDVSDEARDLSREIFQPPLPGLAPVMWSLRRLTAALLPGRLREAFDLPSTPLDRACLDAAARLSRTLVPALPLALRGTPAFLLPTGATLPRLSPATSRSRAAQQREERCAAPFHGESEGLLPSERGRHQSCQRIRQRISG